MVLKHLKHIKSEDQSWTSFAIEIAILIALVIFIRVYVFQFFRVSGPSMCPTLNSIEEKCQYGKGELIFVNEFLYSFIRDPQPGDIVVFYPPGHDKFYIKRVIGVYGDTVKVENGSVYLTNDKVQNVQLPELYLSAKNQGNTVADKNEFVVPEGQFLLFGDNRTESLDARKCFALDGKGCTGENSPFIPRKDIRGRAEFVIWPINDIRWLEHLLFPETKKVDATSSGN